MISIVNLKFIKIIIINLVTTSGKTYALIPSHVTYRLIPLTVVLNSSHQVHTPQGKSRSTSSIIIQISNFGTIPYKFDIPFHITVQKITLPNTDYAHKNITSNFSQARSTLPEDGSQRIRNVSEFIIVF